MKMKELRIFAEKHEFSVRWQGGNWLLMDYGAQKEYPLHPSIQSERKAIESIFDSAGIQI